jgi:uncharacterized membrane protein (UPF0127 family)
MAVVVGPHSDDFGKEVAGSVNMALPPRKNYAAVAPRREGQLNMHSPALRVERADRWHQRLLGLMFRRALAPGLALLLSPCNSVHTAFMRFAIDLVYLDAQGRVLATRTSVRPWRMSWGLRGTRHTLALVSGVASALGWPAGDELADTLRPIKGRRWFFHEFS